MSYESISEDGAFFAEKKQEKERVDLVFGFRGIEEHGHIALNSGSVFYSRLVSGITVQLSGGTGTFAVSGIPFDFQY